MAKLFFTLLLVATTFCTQAQNASIGNVNTDNEKSDLSGGTLFITSAGENRNWIEAGCNITSLAPPSATTNTATSITSFTATLNGTGNPNNEATTGWFRFSTVSPGTPNNTYGTRVPASGGTALGSGSSSVAFSEAITGLAANTTYYYSAIVQNASGISFGALNTFTTPAAPPPPAVTTNAATSLTTSTATLNGNANPNGTATTGWYRYSTVSPGSPNDSYGTRVPASGGTALGSGSSAVGFSEAITGLTANTTYYFSAIAQNPSGISFGALNTFTTPAAPPPPAVTTNAATSLTTSTATLNGNANPNGTATTGWYRYSTVSPGSPNDSYGTRVPASGGTALGSGSSAVGFSEAITGLAANTTYYYSAIAQNASGISFGALNTFTTPAAPTATTNAATSVTASTATLNGSGNPNRSATTGWFRYSTTNPGVGNDVFGTRVPASGGTALGSGSSAVNFLEAITGLAANSIYHYCAITQNAEGITFGTMKQFTTSSQPPSAGGNVGIGTITPQTKLHVAGGTNADLSDSSGYLVIGNLNDSNVIFDNNGIQARINGAATNMYLQANGGNIGIGNTGIPDYQLEISGTAGKPGGGSWSNASDRRLKENIKPYTDGLAAMLSIQPIWYNYNLQSGFDTTKKYVGVLAQDLQKISPYMVSESPVKKAPDGSSYLQVDNGAMTYMLINAVKEQQKIIEELKKRIELLEGKK